MNCLLRSQDAPDKHFSIKSQQSRLFTWSNPLGKRMLCWRFGDTSTATDIYENNLLQVRVMHTLLVLFITALEGLTF